MTARKPFYIALLALCVVHAVVLIVRELTPTLGIDGYLYPNGSPVGGDFINLWTAGRLVLEGKLATIYQPDAFMAYQVGLVGQQIGHRLWAYPPHSLFLATPFALVDYYPALLIWSTCGMAALAWGCRRMGLNALETAIVLVSPASQLCLYYGQTGNLAAGLLLLALSARTGADATAIGAAAMLTIKPQMGFLLPAYWLIERRWMAIAATSGAVLAIGAVIMLMAGVTPWIDYVADTLPELSRLERYGTGPFVSMIPSFFMAFRILSGDGDLAILLHIAVAIPVLAFALWRLWKADTPCRRATLMIAATVLITPYMHNYDLSLLIIAGLLMLRRFEPGGRGEPWAQRLTIVMLAMPQLVVLLNLTGFAVAPLLILPLLFLA